MTQANKEMYGKCLVNEKEAYYSSSGLSASLPPRSLPVNTALSPTPPPPNPPAPSPLLPFAADAPPLSLTLRTYAHEHADPSTLCRHRSLLPAPPLSTGQHGDTSRICPCRTKKAKASGFLGFGAKSLLAQAGAPNQPLSAGEDVVVVERMEVDPGTVAAA